MSRTLPHKIEFITSVFYPLMQRQRLQFQVEVLKRGRDRAETEMDKLRQVSQPTYKNSGDERANRLSLFSREKLEKQKQAAASSASTSTSTSSPRLVH